MTSPGPVLTAKCQSCRVGLNTFESENIYLISTPYFDFDSKILKKLKNVLSVVDFGTPKFAFLFTKGQDNLIAMTIAAGFFKSIYYFYGSLSFLGNLVITSCCIMKSNSTRRRNVISLLLCFCYTLALLVIKNNHL